MPTIEFTASLKPTGKPIKISSENDAEVTFALSSSEIAEVVKLPLLSGKSFKVKVEYE